MTAPVLYGTCEHAGHEVPVRWRHLFASTGAQALLHSHRGWDIGILPVARRVAEEKGFPLRIHRITRLLVDTNRSRGHPGLFSALTRTLDAGERQRLLHHCYDPHRNAVEAELADLIDSGKTVLHLGFHSFTPILNGKVRSTDIGLLYDPARSFERANATRLCSALKKLAPDLRIHRNAPYRGTADGLVTHLRKRWPNRQYGGIEIEVNQRLLGATGQQRRIAVMLSNACSQ